MTSENSAFHHNLHDFEGYRYPENRNENSFDSTVDQLIEHFYERANSQMGHEFAKKASSLARLAITVDAISGMMLSYISEQIRTIKIQTISAILSLVKSDRPHLTIDVIELVFGLSKFSESDIARKHGIDRQVVSKRVVKMRNQFSLSTEQKNITSETYRKDRLAQYERAREKMREIKMR